MASRHELLAVAFLAVACTPKDSPAPAPKPSASAAASTAYVAASANAAALEASVDTVTRASAPYEPGPSVLASGASVDGAALRERHVERLEATLARHRAPRRRAARARQAHLRGRRPEAAAGHAGPAQAELLRLRQHQGSGEVRTATTACTAAAPTPSSCAASSSA